MAPSRKKGSGRAAAAAAARRQWNVGDLVLAKMKGFPAWPAMVSEPKEWGYSSDRKKLLVYFYGTKQIAFCNYADIEAFTEEKKKSLLIKRQGKGADFVRAVDEIIDIYESQKNNKFAEPNSGDEGIEHNAGSFESSRSKSFRKSPEISSHITHNRQPTSRGASVENCEVVSSEEIPVNSVEGNIHYNTGTATSDPTEKVSILDQLRQTPLSTTTTTRKRQKDGSSQNSVIQRVPSLRRSRSSVGGDPHKFQKKTMINGGDLTGSDLTPDVVQENSVPNKKLTGEVVHSSVCCDGGVTEDSTGLPVADSSGDIVSEKAELKSEVEEGNQLEPNGELEQSVNGSLDKDLGLNGSVRLNGKLDLPMKTVIFKKKRKPNRKRAIATQECALLEKDADVQVELHGSLSECPNSRIEINEKCCKADGDEHLPLVKRARVRMGNPPLEESQLDELVAKRENSQIGAAVDTSDKYSLSSCLNNYPTDNTTFGEKEASKSSPIVDQTRSAAKDIVFWKINKNQLNGCTLDVEAALPPSKRLHRALEAMSANAAKSPHDSPETPREIEMTSNGCTQETKQLSDLPVRKVGSPTRSQCTQSSVSALFHNSASGLSSSLTSQILEVPLLTSLTGEPVDSLTGITSPCNKNIKEAAIDVEGFNESSTHIIENSLQSAEKQMNAVLNEGVSDQLPFPLNCENKNEDGNKTLQHTKKPFIVAKNGTMEPIENQSDHVLNFTNASNFLPPNETALIPSATNVGSTASNASGAMKSPSSQSDGSKQARHMQDVANEVLQKVIPKDWGISSDLTPMKDLIAAAQAKRLLSRATSFSDKIVDGKAVTDAVVSPSLTDREGSSIHGSSPTSMVYHRPASDRTHYLQNGSRSPFVSQREKGFNKLMVHAEANVARRSFEDQLRTLSRTKESIGRATRMATDCAKYGIAGEVIDILLQYLEKESSLHRRVDLFFLVDSITQCSRSQKGGPGDVYLSLVQSMLPRLLSAAAPPGNVAGENRRQCLKVLKLWLERKTLPESIVRHHIRELESVSEVSMTNTYSRRPQRTERALNDPVREMEGMLVDEYGSNTSFQLPDFLRPRMVEGDEGSADDEKSFEAVTPERDTEVDDEKEATQPSIEKRRHILEDVDGELEMEDVAPPCAVEVNTCHVAGPDTMCSSHYQLKQHQTLSFAPPLPEDLPPTPPPLPSSPPPVPPSCSSSHTLVPPQQLVGPHAHTDVTDFHLSGITNNIQNQLPQSIRPNNLQGSLMSSEFVPYMSHGFGGLPKQMPPSLSSVSSSGSYEHHTGSHPPIYSANNVTPTVTAPLPNKAYHLQPPPPTVSNQFSYVQAEPQQGVQSWGSCSSFSDRFQYVHDNHGGHFFGDRTIRGPVQHEISERGRFSPGVNTGSVLSERPETMPSSCPPYGLSEPSPNPCHGWPLPPRNSYSVSAPRSALEKPISRVTGAPGCWRPR